MLYFVGIFAYQMLFKAGGLHGLFRYVMASPMFYCVLIYYMLQASHISLMKKLSWFAGCILILLVLLKMADYGSGDRFNFSYAGMYIAVGLSLLLVLYNQFLPKVLGWILALAAIGCITWNTYLFNIYLSNGWIYT